MQYIATITSKRQLTIPAEVYAKLNLKDGEKLVIAREGDSFRITPALRLVSRLAGSVEIPKRFRGLTPDEMIAKAKAEHFKK